MSVLHNNRIVIALCVLLTLAVSSSPSVAYPPDPENAALLYYQAFLTLPKAEEPVDTQFRDYARGKIELNKAIEDYVGSCRGAIKLAVVASELRQCDWGLRYSEGFDMLLSHLGQTRGLVQVLIADARIQVSKGNRELALERCVTALKMSRHVGNETLVSSLVGTAVEAMAGVCIADLLGQMPANSKLLEQLKAELASQAKKPPSVIRPLEMERKVAAEQMSMDKIGDLMRALDAEKSEEEVLEEVRELGGEAFLKKSRDYYTKHMDSVMSILRRGAPYAKTHQQLTELAGQLPEDPGPEKNPEAMFTTAVTPAISRIYGIMIRGRTQANALRTAVDIHISKAKTGKLPNALPSGLPKDLFSGKDFEYEKTKAGFVLRCRAKDLDKDKTQEYDFKVAK
ncbi:MAG: hypothetical protein ISS79_09000 [Phycisphaerae bacterium]|nr:hypothetical protein [Phycisphaerae bacterium]